MLVRVAAYPSENAAMLRRPPAVVGWLIFIRYGLAAPRVHSGV